MSVLHQYSLTLTGYVVPVSERVSAPCFHEFIDPALAWSRRALPAIPSRPIDGVPRCIMPMPPGPIAKALAWRVMGANVALGVWAWLGALVCQAWPWAW